MTRFSRALHWFTVNYRRLKHCSLFSPNFAVRWRDAARLRHECYPVTGTRRTQKKCTGTRGTRVALIVSRRGHTVLAYEYISSAKWQLDLVMDRTIVGKNTTVARGGLYSNSCSVHPGAPTRVATLKVKELGFLVPERPGPKMLQDRFGRRTGTRLCTLTCHLLPRPPRAHGRR